jgi:aminopeptidase N
MSVPITRTSLGFLIFGGLCLAPAASSTIDGPGARIDVLGYVIDIDLQPQTSTFSAAAEITFVLREASDRVRFDLVGLTVDSVKLGDSSVEFSRDAGDLFIGLDASAVVGATVSATVFYGGTPRDGLIFRRNMHGNPTVFADNWPDRARQWFPSVDHPSDKATVEFRVRAPAEWRVVGVGRQLSEEVLDGGRKLTVWATDRPIPVYTMVFGAADLVVGNAGALGCEAAGRRCMPISWWMFPEDASRGDELFRGAESITALFDSLIAPFPYEKLALVQSSTRYGGMENSSAIFLYEQVGQAESTEGLLAHEIAHQWFGDAVTEREWPHLWLSEGFATYFTTVFFELARSQGTARDMRERQKQGYMASPQAVASPVIGEQPENLRDLLNANNYQKGAWVLHMLRRLVGDDKFFNGVRRYFTQYRHGTALTGDFQRIMEEEAGEALDWFFEQWLYRPGYPQVEMRYSWDPSTRFMTMTLEQVQPGPAYKFPLEFEVFFEGQDVMARHAVMMEGRERVSQVLLPYEPSRIVFDPRNDLLAVVVIVR